MNTRRKSERPAKQRKAKEILGEGCGGLDGASVWRVGRQQKIGYRRSTKAAMSGVKSERERQLHGLRFFLKH